MLYQRLAVALLTAVAACNAQAELQNVIVNGGYGMPDEERFVEVVDTLRANSLPNLPPAIHVMSPGTQFVQGLNLPKLPETRQFPGLVRLFLSFYAGMPKEVDEFAVAVSANGARVFQGAFDEPGWHHRLVDLTPWAGQQVDLRFDTSLAPTDRKEGILALPRIVLWHGPKSSGQGGIRIRAYYYASPRITGAFEHTVAGNRELGPGGSLLVEQFDCVTPATIRLESSVATVAARLNAGMHWLGLPLGPDPDEIIRRTVIEGEVAQGATDLIANYLAGDEELLARFTVK